MPYRRSKYWSSQVNGVNWVYRNYCSGSKSNGQLNWRRNTPSRVVLKNTVFALWRRGKTADFNEKIKKTIDFTWKLAEGNQDNSPENQKRI